LKICKICAKSDMLCSVCNKNVVSGEISENDVKISRFLFAAVPDMDFIKSFEAGNRVFIIVAESDVGKIIGRAGKNVKKLAEILGKDVKVLQKDDDKTMIEKALNTPVIGINKVYGENEFYRIRIDKKSKRRLKPGFETVVQSIIDKSEIVFE